jgi:hypothetical protein
VTPGLIDIRSDGKRARDGTVPGAKVIAGNVLALRLEPLTVIYLVPGGSEFRARDFGAACKAVGAR